MVYSVAILGGEEASAILDLLRRFRDVSNIKVFEKVLDKTYVLISLSVDCVDKLVEHVRATLTRLRVLDYDIVLLPVSLGKTCRGVLHRIGFLAKMFLAKLVTAISHVLMPELNYSSLDVLLVRGDIIREIASTHGDLTSVLAELIQRAVYRSEYRVYRVQDVIQLQDVQLNISVRDITRYVHMMFAIADYRVAKFLCVGLSGVFVNTGLLHALHVYTGLPTPIAGLLAIEASILNNFTWNSLWTFKLKSRIRGVRDLFTKLVKYHLAVGVGALVNYVTLVVLTMLLGFHHVVANLIGIGLGALANYLLSDRFVWKLAR